MCLLVQLDDELLEIEELLRHCISRNPLKQKAVTPDPTNQSATHAINDGQIKSWTGHTTDSEVARYTAAADQKALSDAAAELLMANLQKRFANENSNSLEKEA